MGEATGENLDDFGLAVPTSEIVVTLGGETETRVRVLLGASNPTKTALYAKRADRPGVYLVGANLREGYQPINHGVEVTWGAASQKKPALTAPLHGQTLHPS
jgi:hypothetical protein